MSISKLNYLNMNIIHRNSNYNIYSSRYIIRNRSNISCWNRPFKYNTRGSQGLIHQDYNRFSYFLYILFTSFLNSWLMKHKLSAVPLIGDFPDHATFREKGAKLVCADKLGVFLSLTLCNKANFDPLQGVKYDSPEKNVKQE